MPKGEEGIRMIKYEKLETIRNNKKGRNVFFFLIFQEILAFYK